MKFQSPLRDLPREVSVLVVASFFVAVGFGIMVPAIPLFTRSFGVSNAAVGLIISLFAFTRFASGLISGRLVDIFGERTTFAVGVALVAISVGLSGIAQSYGQLLFFRAAGGFGSSLFSVAAS
jgi:MFS family permease